MNIFFERSPYKSYSLRAYTDMITITGTVAPNGKYLLTGAPVNSTAEVPLKISFEDMTGGTNLTLCAGTVEDFAAGVCGMQLSGSGGPGFQFLTIIDVAKLNGMVIYVLHALGTENAKFTVVID
jgi:hypothetical protein